MKNITSALLLLGLIACSGGDESSTVSAASSETETEAPAPAPIENVTADEAAAMLDANPDLVVLDIRTPDEFAGGHLPRAVNIDYMADGFADAIAELDKDAVYLMHCASGGRSTKSLEAFQSAGFKHLSHLDSGVMGWNAAGLPLEN